jgi:Transposase DDE domain group 1
MPTRCNAERFDFGIVEGRAVDGTFDAGLVTSDAGALLLGAADRAIALVERFGGCFRDYRRQDLIEHTVATLVRQRVRSAMKTSMTMTNCATIRSWRCWRANWKRDARTVRRWRASRH